MPTRTHRLLVTTTALSLCLLPMLAQALPTGGTVAGGTASIATSGSATTVTQTSSKAVIDWTGFNTSGGQTVTFKDPGSSSITLNRISGPATSFAGALNSNGQVWLINPEGIAFSSTAKVNAYGLLATTSDISNTNFMNGTYSFSPDLITTSGGSTTSPSAASTVSNAGSITVAGAGLVSLVAPHVANSGTITAQASNVSLASGDTFTVVDLAGDGLISLAASKYMTQQGLANTGTISDTGGTVLLTAAQASNLLDNVINLNGVVTAENLDAANQSGDLNYGVKFNDPNGGNVEIGAYRNVAINSGTSISPGTKTNILIGSDDTGAAAGGAITIASGDALNSGGGNITLGGGNLSASGYAVGTSGSSGAGITLNGATLNAGGGNITLNGKGASDYNNESNGIFLNSFSADNTLSTTGNGTITLNGVGGTGSTLASYGINSGGTTIIAAQNGAISITGTGNASGEEGGVSLDSTLISTSGGAVKITGTTAGGATSGEVLAVALNSGSVITQNGSITISGTAGNALWPQAVSMWGGETITSRGTGSINISATDGNPGASDTSYALLIGDTSNISTNSGAITISGSNTGTAGTGNIATWLSSADVSSTSGAINITGTDASTSGGTALRIDGSSYSGASYINDNTGKVTLTGKATGTGLGNVGIDIGQADIDSYYAGTNATMFTINGSGSASGIELDSGASFQTDNGNFSFTSNNPIVTTNATFKSTGNGTFNFSPGAILSE